MATRTGCCGWRRRGRGEGLVASGRPFVRRLPGMGPFTLGSRRGRYRTAGAPGDRGRAERLEPMATRGVQDAMAMSGYAAYGVREYANWGRLVKTWATGEDHVGDGNRYPRPTTLEEFKRQTEQANCGVVVPDGVTKLQIVQGDRDTLVVRLPSAEMIRDIEAQISGLASQTGDAPYPLPKFYLEAWQYHPPKAFDRDGLLAFNDKRVGEYTINNCA